MCASVSSPHSFTGHRQTHGIHTSDPLAGRVLALAQLSGVKAGRDISMHPWASRSTRHHPPSMCLAALHQVNPTRRTDLRANTCGQRHDVLLPAAGSGVATSDPAHVRPRRAQASARGPAGPSVDASTVARRSSAAHVRQMLEGLSNGVTSKPQARKPGDREKKTKAKVRYPRLEPAYIGQKSDAVQLI